MAGGLIQIVTYGNQDLYLTGAPEITFFKIVYRRHTNFSAESISVQFDDSIKFGKECILSVPKVGDLIKNVYLEVIIPEIAFKRNPNGDNIVNNADITEYNTAVSNYNTVVDFMLINIEAYRKAYETYTAENVTTVEDIVESIISYMSSASFTDIINNYISLVSLINSNKTNILTIANNYNGDTETLKDVIMNEINNAIVKSELLQKDYYTTMLTAYDSYMDKKHENLKFAWVDKLGHSIIDYVEIYIGGNRIDKHYGEWLNIWNELTNIKGKKDLYNELIGNVKELTTFDRETKPQYTLQIPLQFWFCRTTGLALPLVSLEFHDVYFKVKFKEFTECAYMEDNNLIYFSHLSEELYLDEITEEDGLILQANMLIDYIYLDKNERRKFAQSSNEYLIEQVQMREFTDISSESVEFHLDFNHPCKELIWVGQKTEYTENINGYTKCRWDNYTKNDNNTGNTVDKCQLDFNGYTRVLKSNGAYFNYVLPYSYHTSTPQDGINIFSFSLTPESHQPSGQCNMSRLSKVSLFVDFVNELFVEPIDAQRVLNFRVYAVNYNILRFLGGMAGCAYSSG